MVTRRDYTAEAVEAAKSVLIELTHLLGEYRDNIVLIGGWVPELLIPQKSRPHVGSIDICYTANRQRAQAPNLTMLEAPDIVVMSRGLFIHYLSLPNR